MEKCDKAVVKHPEHLDWYANQGRVVRVNHCIAVDAWVLGADELLLSTLLATNSKRKYEPPECKECD
jgi:hypothetical protein